MAASHDFDSGDGISMRKPNYRADLHIGAAEDALGVLDRVGFYASRGDVVGAGKFEPGLYLGIRHGGVQEGVIDHFGELGEGNGDFGGERHCGGELNKGQLLNQRRVANAELYDVGEGEGGGGAGGEGRSASLGTFVFKITLQYN